MNTRVVLFCLGLFLSVQSFSEPLTPSQALTCSKLRQYCQACHALGELRFIYSDNNEELWREISYGISPKSKMIWKRKIYEVLNWPTDAPPSFQEPMSASGDWMPKGIKRLDLANDKTDGTFTRRIMLETLKD